MATMTNEQKKKVTSQMASKFFAPVSRPAPGAPRERAASAGRVAGPQRTRDPVLDQVAASLLANPVVSRDRNLTDSQNAQLTRDSMIKTARQNQEIAGRLLERDLANRGSFDTQRLSNAGDLAQQRLRNQGELSEQELRNKGALETTTLSEQGATGRVNLQEQGAADRLTKSHQYGLETLGEQNKYNREAANRSLVEKLLSGGATGDAKMNLLYNQGGAFNADLEGMAVPQRLEEPYSFQKLGGGVNELGLARPDELLKVNKQTGEVEYAYPDLQLPGALPDQTGQAGAVPARKPSALGSAVRNTSYSGKVAGALADRILGARQQGSSNAPAPAAAGAQQPGFTEQDLMFAENTLGKEFDPYNANPEQKKYLSNLMSVNRPLFDHLMSKYATN